MSDEKKQDGPKLIYLVEDDKFMSDLLVKEFTTRGYEIIPFVNGEDIFKTLETRAPRIFILDVLLPGMSGFDVLAKIKQNETWKNIPAIFLSNMQSKEDLEKSKSLNATAYYIKALVTPRMIVEEVSKILR
jgi:two-component system alkaline phosphatase synthesis response regulator PhoP